VTSGPFMHSIKLAREVDLGSSLHSGGRTLRDRKYSGSVSTTFLLVENPTRCQEVY
jgi:hypothetical protein